MVTKKTKPQKKEFLKERKTLNKSISKGSTTDKTLIKKGCIDKESVLANKYKVKERIGTESISGEVNKGCFPLNCKYKIAIKKVPITYELKYVDRSEDPSILNQYEVYSELFFLKLSSFLVHNDITPNLPLLYDKYSCDEDCNFINPELKGKKKCLLIVNELANGDLKYILTKVQPNIDTLKIMYFQIYTALYCMRKYFNMYHNDLHYGNVLYRKVKPGGYIKYIIEGQPIIVPNVGYIMILWDFGRSFIPGKIQPYRNSKEEEFMDFNRITQMIGGNKGKNEKLYDKFESVLLQLIERSKSYKDFILLYGYLVNNPEVKEDSIISVYNTDKKLTSKDPNINKYLINTSSKKNTGMVSYIKRLFYNKTTIKKTKTMQSKTLVNSKTKTKL